jgi:hypothetical protein
MLGLLVSLFFLLMVRERERERERELLESSFLDEKNVKAMGRAERRRKVIFCCRGRSYDKYISVLVFFFFFLWEEKA